MIPSPKNSNNKNKNKKNTKKNLNSPTKDISNNDLFFNIGSIIIDNPLLKPLPGSKGKKNENIKKFNIEGKHEKPCQNKTTMKDNKRLRMQGICFNNIEKSNKNIKTNVTNKKCA